MFLTFNFVQGMEGIDPIRIIDKTQYVEDIMYDLVSEEKQNEGIRSNFIEKRLDDLNENNMKKLIFKILVECEVLYFTYAKAVGFGVRRETPRITRHGIVTSLRFCCDCERVRSEKDKNRKEKKRKARDETRDIDECEVLYFTYAKAVGFGVRRETPRITRHGIVTSLRFCYDCERVRSEKDKNRKEKKRKARDETRCFCKAFIRMKYMKKNTSVYSRRVQEGTQSSSWSTSISESNSSFQGYR
ncbi:hypothetical protein Cgig2_002657 [Carnegiea gigantea]|uniref:FAR1 domain-containing protein n=1 Tax=Carnegiea gigantea TaxID=171969 RepID=A0A9Q1GH44_9CARY|nr:hypothetical protein Cgig2_002657 [Carnegiea gigantea]